MNSQTQQQIITQTKAIRTSEHQPTSKPRWYSTSKNKPQPTDPQENQLQKTNADGQNRTKSFRYACPVCCWACIFLQNLLRDVWLLSILCLATRICMNSCGFVDRRWFFPNSCLSTRVLMDYYITGVVSGAVARYLPPEKVVSILARKFRRRWNTININENQQNAPKVKFQRVAQTLLKPMKIKQNDSLRCTNCDRIIEILQ